MATGKLRVLMLAGLVSVTCEAGQVIPSGYLHAVISVTMGSFKQYL